MNNFHNKHWILDDELQPVEVSAIEWARWIKDREKSIIQRTRIGKKGLVSTIFLGIDHSFGEGNVPILYETMAFDTGTELDEDTLERYATLTEAIEGHAKIVEQINDLLIKK